MPLSSRPNDSAPEPTGQPIAQKGLREFTDVVPGVVITVSDRCAAGVRPDASGPLAVELLRGYGVSCPAPVVVGDGAESVRAALSNAIASGARVVLTTGGTGVTPRDLTPEGTLPVLECRLEGLENQIRAHGLANTPLAGLSRGYVGVTGRGADACLVVNAPGSRGGVTDAVAVIGPLIPHVLEQLGGGDHVVTPEPHQG